MRYILFLVLVFSLTSCETDQERTKPSIQTINESVYASVTVQPATTYYPATSKSGVISRIHVSEGDTVSRGQLLFEIAASDIVNRINDATLDAAQAKANYSGDANLLYNIELELDLQAQQVLLDSINYNRQRRLWDQQIGTKVALDKASLTYEASKSKYKLLQEKYQQTNTTLQTNYKKAINRVQTQKLVAQDYKVKSTMTGRVYSLLKQEGETLNVQERFGEIGSIDQFVIMMDIDEVDIAKININDTVVVSLDAYPNQVYTAIITTIYPKKDPNTQTFSVESQFVKMPPKLYSGLSGEANIIMSTRHNVMIIPTSYLINDNEVMTENGLKTITVGMKNLEFLEVISGIDTATVIIKDKP